MHVHSFSHKNKQMFRIQTLYLVYDKENEKKIENSDMERKHWRLKTRHDDGFYAENDNLMKERIP